MGWLQDTLGGITSTIGGITGSVLGGTTTTQTTTDTTTTPTPDTGKSNISLFLITGLVVLGIIGVVWYATSGGKEKSTA